MLAGKNIRGEKTDDFFLDIIRYYPEASAYDELTSAWCAAFVYHCALLAGITLPIRYAPSVPLRFACVGAWYEWGTRHKLCYYAKDGFVPAKGDIVIYDNIIPPENKPEGKPWYDHIGVVLSYDNDGLTVAEGNVDNKNISNIMKRKADNTVGCYIRIPNGYEYDGWKYDYKTQEIRI